LKIESILQFHFIFIS